MKQRTLTLLSLSLSILTVTGMITGCSNTGLKDNDNKYTVKQEFGSDSSTMKKDNLQYQIEEEQAQEDEETLENYEDDTINIGEIDIVNEDTSIDWEVDGDDIVYKDTRFNGLYKIHDRLQLPCDETTFINFIVKTLHGYGSLIDVHVETSFDENTDTEDTDISIDEALSELEDYNAIKESYDNTPATWRIVFNYDGNSKFMFGSSKYIIYNGSGDLITVDMDQVNGKLNLTGDVTDTEIEESTEENVDEAQ